MTPEERNRLTREANMRIPGGVKPSADALIRLCELNDAYIDAVIAELPTVEGVKSFRVDKEEIEFDPNHLPKQNIVDYAQKIKDEHPEIWKLGGNIFGNKAFENLKRVRERGKWLEEERPMYIKWRSFVARHKGNFRIEGVVAMLKWCDEVERGWGYMKDLIEAEIKKREDREDKAVDWGSDPFSCHDKCNHAVHFKSYTPREISDIERAFRAAVGSAAVNALLDDEELWIALAAGINAEGEGSPLPPARESMANITAEWAYEEAKKTWNANFRRYGQEWAADNPLNPSALSITSETGWLNRMNKEGYKLVRDKIKLEYLPRIKEIIGTQAAEQVPWNQIASNLRKEMQFGKRWDWVRLVRTEMKHSSYVAQMEQYEATGIPFVRWSASRAGNTCEDCQELNGKIFRINTGKNMIFAESDYDPESEALQVCPPPVHPQCRCVQIPVWGKKKVKVPSAMEFRAQQGL